MDSTPVASRINTAGEDVLTELVADLLQRVNVQERRYIGAPATASVIAVDLVGDLPSPAESDYAYVVDTDQVYTKVGSGWSIGGTPPGW